MKTIELIGHIDDQHRLSAAVPADLPTGEVKIILEVPDAEQASEDWARAVSRAWNDDWNDPREDIYTLNDGEPNR